MRYLGSKTMLLEQIGELVKEYNGGVFCDPFGGIGTVGAFMKQNGYRVVSGDLLNFAHYFQCVLIEFDDNVLFEELMQYLGVHSLEELEIYLSSLVKLDGWLVQEYASKRKFFTIENAFHIQACIEYIREWFSQGIIDENEHMVLIASLINSFDKVANTAGTYYAYLKEYYRKAVKPFRFSLMHPVKGISGCSFRIDANDLVKQTKCDILYLDPPYNELDYARYYHLPETISLGIEPKPMGISGVYTSSAKKSVYNGKNATEAFVELIKNADAQCIIFHYIDNGMINMNIAREALHKKGLRFEEFYLNCRGYTTTTASANYKHHIIKVSL